MEKRSKGNLPSLWRTDIWFPGLLAFLDGRMVSEGPFLLAARGGLASARVLVEAGIVVLRKAFILMPSCEHISNKQKPEKGLMETLAELDEGTDGTTA